MLVDTPGQIEVFTWSASGSIITDSFASSFPTVSYFNIYVLSSTVSCFNIYILSCWLILLPLYVYSLNNANSFWVHSLIKSPFFILFFLFIFCSNTRWSSSCALIHSRCAGSALCDGHTAKPQSCHVSFPLVCMCTYTYYSLAHTHTFDPHLWALMCIYGWMYYLGNTAPFFLSVMLILIFIFLQKCSFAYCMIPSWKPSLAACYFGNVLIVFVYFRFMSNMMYNFLKIQFRHTKWKNK